MMARVSSYKRHIKGKITPVSGYTRAGRKYGQGRIVSSKPVKLYPVRDKMGAWKGYTRKRR